MEDKIMVSVICTTYNHEKYIRQCLESLVEQKTDFPYEVVVQDDCSTDQTPEVIREFESKYPDRIKAVYNKENQFSKGVRPAYAAAQYARGKYLAHCEGDDYWCDSKKLQDQFDYLEAHKDCSLCFHNSYTYYDDLKTREDTWTFWKDRNYKGPGKYSSEELVELNVVPLSSVMYRAKDIDDVDLTSDLVKYGDIAKTLWLANRGYGYCLDRTMSVYRRNSATSTMSKVYSGIEQYNRGIIATIELYENFNTYSNYRFDDILKASIHKLKDLTLRMDWDVLNPYETLNPDIYIYGTGVFGAVCAIELTKKKIEFNGFVVSDGQEKVDSYKEHKVKYLSEIEDKQSVIIPAVGKKILPIIINNLTARGFTNICEALKEGEDE